MPGAVPPLLITLAVLYSVGIVVSIGILVNRWIEDAFWVYRVKNGLFAPHGVDISAIALLMMFILGSIDLWFFRAFAVAQSPPFWATRGMLLLIGFQEIVPASQIFLEIIELANDNFDEASNSQPTSRQAHHARLIVRW